MRNNLLSLAARAIVTIAFLMGIDTVARAQWTEDLGHVGNIKSLQGQVREGDDSPIPEASIRLMNVDTEVTFSTIADKSGRFHVRGLSKGTYNVSVSAKGHNLASFSVSVATHYSSANKRIVIVRLSPGCASGNSGVTFVSKFSDRSFSDN